MRSGLGRGWTRKARPLHLCSMVTAPSVGSGRREARRSRNEAPLIGGVATLLIVSRVGVACGILRSCRPLTTGTASSPWRSTVSLLHTTACPSASSRVNWHLNGVECFMILYRNCTWFGWLQVKMKLVRFLKPSKALSLSHTHTHTSIHSRFRSKWNQDFSILYFSFKYECKGEQRGSLDRKEKFHS